MRDPVTEDAYEQDGSYIRPYIPGEGQYGGEGDRFWSEEQDEHALGGAAGEQGDVLSEGWRPDQPAQTPADHADQDDYAAGRTPRSRPEEPLTDEEYGRAEYAGGEEYGRAEYADGEEYGREYGSEYAGSREYTGDGDTDPRGFLGSGWRNAPDEDDDEDRPRRGGLLLRAGLIAVGALGVIWALALWVGQPSGEECAGGTDCAAKAGTTATAPASPAADDAAAGESDALPTDEPVDEPIEEPTDGVPTDAPTSAPTRTRPATSETSAPTASSAPTHASRSRAQDTGGSQGDDTPRPSRSRVAVDTNDRSSAGDRSEEQTSATNTGESEADTAPTSDPATEQPAPAPTQESSGGRGGGLFGWLFD